MTWDELPVGTTMEGSGGAVAYLKMNKKGRHLSRFKGVGIEFHDEGGMHGRSEVNFKLYDNWRHFPQEFFE